MLNIAPTSINTTTKETTLFPLEQGWIEALQAHLNLSQISPRKSHVENCRNFNGYCNNSNDD